MNRGAQLREALNHLPVPPDNEDWFKMLTPLKSAGFNLEEVLEWSSRGGAKEKWVEKLRGRWHQLREMDHDHAVNTVFKRARDAGWLGGPVRSGRHAPTPPDLARMAGPQKSFRGTAREGAYTVADLKAESIWFVHSGKAPYQHKIEGGLAGYRQSLPSERGDVARARYGGEIIWEDKHRVPHRFLVYPHRQYQRIADLIPRVPDLARPGDIPVDLLGRQRQPPAPDGPVDRGFRPEARRVRRDRIGRGLQGPGQGPRQSAKGRWSASAPAATDSTPSSGCRRPGSTRTGAEGRRHGTRRTGRRRSAAAPASTSSRRDFGTTWR